MRTAVFPRASRIGFGCASLGSRVGASQGAAALTRAFDRGVNWFDLAPSYGDGQAEEIFERFARGRRSEVHICTKCGLMAPRVGVVATALRPLARSILAHAPSLRKAIAAGRGGASRVPLTGAYISASIDQSLKRLRTDYVDVFALHDPLPGDLAREDVRTALDAVVASGRARAIGIAGPIESAKAALKLDLPIRHIQVANNPFAPQIHTLLRTFGPKLESIFITTHSTFGGSTMVDRLVTIVDSDRKLEQTLRRTGYDQTIHDGIRSALIDFALMSNPAGTILLSMFKLHNLEFNMRLAEPGRSTDPLAFFDTLKRNHGSSNELGLQSERRPA